MKTYVYRLIFNNLKCLLTNLRVLIKFEVDSWLKKNNRLYEQGAVRPINLGGVWGHAPPENFEIWRL